ncbi:MAG: VCBS repeat-containing protein, partial [bacterium]
MHTFLLVAAGSLLFGHRSAEWSSHISQIYGSQDGRDENWRINRSAKAVLSFTDITLTGLGDTRQGTHGLAFCDINGDQLPDLYVTMFWNRSMSERFFQNLGENVFEERAWDLGIQNVDGGSHGACFADFDNDGDYDLLNGSTLNETQTGPSHNHIYRNDGGTFVDVTPNSMSVRNEGTRAVIAFDTDGDGDLDIFTVTGVQGSNDSPTEKN